ncbi:MAG: phosphoribosylanthranilate isomerase [Opitutales bacterium]
MNPQVKVKICGLTRENDVDLALDLGADFCGFIVYPNSPRGLSLERAFALSRRVPEGKRVLVDVAPSVQDLTRYRDAGFDYYQIHADVAVGLDSGPMWSNLVGRDHLWMAPRMKPETDFPPEILDLTDTVLLDTYHQGQIGGTGEVGDWAGFAKLKREHEQINWILAGGLNAGNVLNAIDATGADFVDVSSGVELEPGIKSSEKLSELFRMVKPA